MTRVDGSRAAQFSVDGVFWRRLANVGATRFPQWWLRYAPPFFGLAACVLVPDARRAVARNLERTRGPVGRVRSAVDVGRTFATYAGALAEGLAIGTTNLKMARATILGELHVKDLVRKGGGAVVVTAHTAGWEVAGPLLANETKARMMMVMQAERDADARALHDKARNARGLQILHVGEDPLASLGVLSHVRGGGLAAIQLDRTPPGMRVRRVKLFGKEGHIPEGPLRIAQLARAPMIPIFCAREGFAEYLVDIAPPIHVPPRATEAELDAIAQTVADAMTRFICRYPTQWLMFHR